MGDQVPSTAGGDLLEEMSASEFNDQLISRAELLCKNCNKFLWPPIMLGKDGNFCGLCNKTGENVIHNSVLELMLQQLRIPCIYSENGCKVRSKYFDMAVHVMQCPYRNYGCPINLLQECKWSGYYNCFLQHFNQEHPDFVSVNSVNAQTFNVNTNQNAQIPHLISIPNGTFMLISNCDLSNQLLKLSVFHVGNPESAKNFQFVVQQKGSKDIFTSHETSKFDILSITNFGKEDPDGLKMDLNVLRSLACSNDCECTIKIFLKEDDQGEMKLDETFLKYIECPVCNNYMRPPIYQCLSGHSLCHRCRPKMGQCPTCRSGFGSTRNYALEEFTNGICFPCMYREQGCMRTLPANDINKHEMECILRPYNCPLCEINPFPCRWMGTHSKILAHLKDEHSDYTVNVNYLKNTVTFSFDRQFFEMYCLIAYGEVFRVCHKRDTGNQNSYWSIQLVGPRGEAKNYKCEVGLIDERSPHRRLIRVDVCQDFTNHDNLFNQSIMIPTSITSWFSFNNQLTYYVKIKQSKM